MKINVKNNKEDKNLIVEPIEFSLSKLKGLNIRIKNLNSAKIENNNIIISYSDYDINLLYSKINEIFKEIYSCEIEFDEETIAVFSDAKEEADNFDVFSRKAFDIRNNKNIPEDLKSLVGILSAERFKRELKPFQLLASYHLAFSQNACNFSVPGSGKTSTVLAAYELLKNIDDSYKRIEKLLVISPLSAFYAWRSEYKECYGKEPEYLEIRGGVKDEDIVRQLIRSHVQQELILINYESVVGRQDLIIDFIRNNSVMLVLDEAHRIKNAEDGVRSKAVLSLSPYAKARVILTGTPAANSYVDLYNLYKFIWPLNNIIGYSPMQLKNMSKNDNDPRIKDLMNRIAPFYIRVKKSDLGLPDPIYNNPTIIEMPDVQRIIYEAIEEMAINTFEKEYGYLSSTTTEKENVMDIFRRSAFIRLRQAATNPRLLNKPIDKYLYENPDEEETVFVKEMDDSLDIDNNILNLIRDYSEIPGKFKAALDLTKQIISEKGKIIIWCEFIGTCDDLSDYFSENNIYNVVLYGNTDQEERERAIIEFHENPKLGVIIANPHAVGEAISLHKACHNALYLEQGYNAGVYMQSKDRIHRVGLKDSDVVNYYYYHSANSVDNVVYERVMIKERRMLDLIESEDIPLITKNVDFMSDMEDDIKAIMRAYYERKNQSI